MGKYLDGEAALAAETLDGALDSPLGKPQPMPPPSAPPTPGSTGANEAATMARKTTPAFSSARHLLTFPREATIVRVGPSQIATCLGFDSFKPRAEAIVDLWARHEPAEFKKIGGITRTTRFNQIVAKPRELEQTMQKIDVRHPDAIENFKLNDKPEDLTFTTNTRSGQLFSKTVESNEQLASVAKQLAVNPTSMSPDERAEFVETVALNILKEVSASKTGTAQSSINMFKEMLVDVDKMNPVELAVVKQVATTAAVPYEEIERARAEAAANRTMDSDSTRKVQEELAKQVESLNLVSHTGEDVKFAASHMSGNLAKEFGTRTEDNAARTVEQVTKRTLNLDRKFYNKPLISSSFSGLPYALVGRVDRVRLDESDGKPWIHEIKNRTRGLYRSIPVTEYFQLQGYMYLTGIPRAEWTQHFNGAYAAKTVDFNEREWMDEVLPRLRAFCYELDEIVYTERAQAVFRRANPKYFQQGK